MGLRIKQNVDLKELEKFGFKHREGKSYEYIRELDNKTAYRIYTTKKHAYIQIEIFEPMVIAKGVQNILYDLIQAGLVEKVEE